MKTFVFKNHSYNDVSYVMHIGILRDRGIEIGMHYISRWHMIFLVTRDV